MKKRLQEIQDFRRKGASFEEFCQFLLNSRAHQKAWIETQPNGKKQLESWQEVLSQREALKHPNEWIRDDALEKLGQLGMDAKLAVPAVCKLLLDSDTSLRLNAVDLLGRLSVVSQEALEGLKLAAQNEIQKVRFRAFQQIRRLVQSDYFEPKEAFEFLLLFFKDSSAYLRSESEQIISQKYPHLFEEFLKNDFSGRLKKRKLKNDRVEE